MFAVYSRMLSLSVPCLGELIHWDIKRDFFQNCFLLWMATQYPTQCQFWQVKTLKLTRYQTKLISYTSKLAFGSCWFQVMVQYPPRYSFLQFLLFTTAFIYGQTYIFMLLA
jgi:hypothetical protein